MPNKKIQQRQFRPFRKRIGKVRALSPSKRHEKLFGERPFSYIRYKNIYLKKNIGRFGMSPAERRFSDLPERAQKLVLAHHEKLRVKQKSRKRSASYYKKSIIAAINAKKVYLSLEYFVRNSELFCYLTRYCNQNNLEFVKNTFKGSQCKMLMRGIEIMIANKKDFLNAAKSFLEKRSSRFPAQLIPKWQALFVELGLATRKKPNINKLMKQKLGEIITSRKTVNKLVTLIQEGRPLCSTWLPHLRRRIEAEEQKYMLRLQIRQNNNE